MSDRHNKLSFEQLHDHIVGNGTHNASVVVGKLFMLLLFRSKLDGTTYLKEAVLYRYENSSRARVSLTKEIYPAVANKLNTTVERVERAVRNTIKDCYEHGNLFALNNITHSELISKKYLPTNGELISIIVDWLTIERQQNHIR